MCVPGPLLRLHYQAEKNAAEHVFPLFQGEEVLFVITELRNVGIEFVHIGTEETAYATPLAIQGKAFQTETLHGGTAEGGQNTHRIKADAGGGREFAVHELEPAERGIADILAKYRGVELVRFSLDFLKLGQIEMIAQELARQKQAADEHHPHQIADESFGCRDRFMLQIPARSTLLNRPGCRAMLLYCRHPAQIRETANPGKHCTYSTLAPWTHNFWRCSLPIMNRKFLLWLEFAVIFGAVPLAYALNLVPLPKIPLLLVFFLVTLVYLLRHPAYDKRELLHRLNGHSRELKRILVRSCGVAVLSVIAVTIIDPALLFGFPRTMPLLWLLVMILYPLLSAYPQEVIYRAFLFKRYEEILPSPTLAIWGSTLAFSFLHIVFDNWLAVILTIPAGYIFSRTYIRTESLFLASVEHAIYGCIIFTSGLGGFFYNPS